jgi:hypothetical protein
MPLGLFTLLHSLPSQAKEVTEVVKDAYERNVYIGTITLLAIASTTLLGLYVRAVKAHSKEVRELHSEYRDAADARAEKQADADREKDQAFAALVERAITAIVTNTAAIDKLIDSQRDRR